MDVNQSVSKKKISLITAAMIVFIVVLIIIIMVINNREYQLTKSHGKISVHTVKTINTAGAVTNYDLEDISVEDIFNKYDTSIVEGEVKKIKYIEIKVGEMKVLRAVITIKITEIFRGDLITGNEIDILVPVKSTVATVSDYLEMGIKGIFMIVKYDEAGDKYYIKSGDNKLVLKDITDYGLLNGVYWLFLNKDGKCIFDREKYAEIGQTDSWQDIEMYVKDKIKSNTRQ